MIGGFMWSRFIQITLCCLLLNSIAIANDINQLDGDWYSFKWKYGYSLSEGKGVTFATNSPNFKVGQEIVRLTSVAKNTFVGENIYKDGKFYKIKATLQADGKLLFEGEKNVKWTMEKIDPETYSSLVNTKIEKESPKPEIPTASGPTEYTHYDDGSCTPDTNKKCVSKEQLAALCKKTSAWYTSVFGLIGVGDNFINTLYRNSGASAFKNGSVYVAKSGQCAFKFDAIGMINGTSYNRTYYCAVTTIVDDGKRKGDSLAVSSVSSFGCVQ
jgi:hypothetical protein